MTDGWIVIPGWEKFQHYRDRAPTWIKVYTELLHDPDYLRLTLPQRGVLHGLWMLYASSNGQIPDNTASVSRALGERVLRTTLDRLNDAGFIEISASRPLALARSQETETEKRREKNAEEPASFKIPDLLNDIAPDDVAKFVSRLRDADGETQHVLQKLRRSLPFAAFENAFEALEYRRRNPPPLESEVRYFVATLKSLAKEGTYP